MKLKLTLICFIFFFTIVSIFAQSGLQITEIMFDVPQDTLGDANGDGIRGSHSDEFVEIYNGGSAAVDLTAYQIIEREGVPVFTFPLNSVLAPGQFAVVFGAIGTAGIGSNLPSDALYFAVNENDDNNDGFDNGLGKSNFSNSADRVMLVNPLLADTVAEIDWGGTTSHPISTITANGIYLGPPNTVLGDSISGSVAQSVTHSIGSDLWGIHSIVTGDPTSLFSPGKDAVQNTNPILPNIQITEVMFDVPKDSLGDANGDGVRGSHSDEFIEIYNNGPIDADLTGFQILDKDTMVVYQFPDSTKLKIGQFAVVFGAVGSNGFGPMPSEALVFAKYQSDDNLGFDDENGGHSNFSNSHDAVVIVNSIENDTTSEIYWGSASPVSSKAVYLGPPNTISGDSIKGKIGQSVTSRLNSNLWDKHTVVAGSGSALFSPGIDARTPPQVNNSDLIITEIMFDVPKDSVGDANGDGVRGSKSDEFVEIYNRGSAAINVSGYQIVEREGVPVYTFPIGTTINPAQFVVVFGAVDSNGFGSNLPPDAIYLAVHDTSANIGFDNGIGKTNFSNSHDNCLLINPANSDTLDEVYWGTATPLSTIGVYFGFPNTISGTTISGGIAQSVTLDRNLGLWDKHTVVTDNATDYFSPGKDAVVVDGVKSENLIPTKFVLSQNYPNPFNPSTIISFSMPYASKVTLRIYNILGQEIATLADKKLSSGVYQYTFDASNLATGVYIYSLRTSKGMMTKKMLLLK